MFTDHKIEKFTKTVGGLPDQPNIEPQALKNWFDAAPEELRQSLNGVCEDGAALESRVNGIIERTFAGNVSESMLDDALAGKLNGKAEGSALTAEQSARESADAALDGRTTALESKMDTVQTALAAKCEVVFGTYKGMGTTTTQTISLGFYPLAVLIMAGQSTYSETTRIPTAFATRALASLGASLNSNGFAVTGELNDPYMGGSTATQTYRYIAFKPA
ncbi:MAG: hypothetical protein EOM63_00885 [Clostridia bacterium]|nr:hypothetical protein [Clostridia bacterium]